MIRKCYWSIFVLLLLVASIGFGSPGGEKEGPVTIKFIMWYQEPKEVIEKFNSSQDKIIVEFEQVTSDQYINVLNTRLMSGEAPDIFAVRNASIYEQLAKDGRLVDLTDKPWMKNYKDHILERSEAADGHIYGVVGSSVGILGFYNKTLFDKYGLVAPTSWEEYLEVCEVLKNNGAIPQVQGTQNLSEPQFIVHPEFAMWFKHKDWTDGIQTGKYKYTDPEVIEVLGRLQTFAERGYLHPGFLSLNSQQAWQVFCEGNVGMMGGGSWFASRWFPQITPTFEWGMYNLCNNLSSLGEPSLLATALRVHLLVIPEEAHVNEALTFLEWMSQPENHVLLGKEWSFPSMVKGGLKPEADSISEKVYDYMNLQDTMPNVEAPGEIMNDRLKAMQDILAGNKTAEEAGIEIQKKVNAAFGLE